MEIQILIIPTFSGSLSAPKLQWGWGSSTRGNYAANSTTGFQIITFPLQFSSCFGVNVSSFVDTSGVCELHFQISSYSTTTATIRVTYSGSQVRTTISPFWMAIGK